MATDIEKILKDMRSGSTVLFIDLLKVCTHYFGAHRVKGSHHVFKTPWAGDPWVNVQAKGKDAKAYQIRQALKAIDKKEQLDAAARGK